MERIISEFNHLEHLNYVSFLILFFLSITQLLEATNCKSLLTLEKRNVTKKKSKELF